MSQLYIAQDTPLQCTDGRRLIGIGVSSQSSVYLKGGTKLMATEKDRFKDNFICPKMMAAGAIAGAALAAAFSGGLFMIAAAAFAGSALIDDALNICSLLCKGSQWSGTHPKVRIEGKKPLLQDSKLKCFLGGQVGFMLLSAPEIQEAMNAAKMAQDSYHDNDAKNPAQIGDYTRVNTDSQAALDELFGPGTLTPADFNTNAKNGFYASLYRHGETGDYFVAFRGSEPKGWQFYHDWFIEDGGQALGFRTPQIEKTRMLAEKMSRAAPDQVQFTGHSLGGGNSAMASYYTGLPGYTFNARGVHRRTLEYLDEKQAVGSTDQIINYSTSNDILNALQNNREGLLATIGGSRFNLLKALGIGGLADGAVPRALGQQNEIFGYIDKNEGLGLSTIGSGHSAYADALEAMVAAMNTTVLAKNV